MIKKLKYNLELFRLLRPHHWLKNLLIFLVPLTGHKWVGYGQILEGFISLCFLSSAIYIIDDLYDLKSDREHPVKKSRPLAKGKVKIKDASIALILLLAFSFFIGFSISSSFCYIIAFSFSLNLLYIFYLKKFPVIDVICLTAFFMIRIIAGSIVSEIPPGEWFIVFNLFVFFSLALLKRYVELQILDSPNNQVKSYVRGYSTTDLPIILSFGIQSSMASILVLCLYINSGKVIQMYSHNQFIWFIVPLYLYWIVRIWLLAVRGKVNYDPLVFASKDIQSYITGVLISLVVYLAM